MKLKSKEVAAIRSQLFNITEIALDIENWEIVNHVDSIREILDRTDDKNNIENFEPSDRLVSNQK